MAGLERAFRVLKPTSRRLSIEYSSSGLADLSHIDVLLLSHDESQEANGSEANEDLLSDGMYSHL